MEHVPIWMTEALEPRLLLNGHLPVQKRHRSHLRHARTPAIHATLTGLLLAKGAKLSTAAMTGAAFSSPGAGKSALVPTSWQAYPDILSHRSAIAPMSNKSPTVGSKTPAQMRGAYGLGQYGASPITFGGVQGDGSGQTIAIVDAYNYPTALNDLNAFSAFYNLPTFNSGAGSPTFSRLNQNGLASNYPGTDPAGAGNGTWEEEAALDIEWAHVMAPKANITLVEANDASNNLYTAVSTASHLTGVVAVSMSWGGGETGGEAGLDSTYFTSPAGHIGGGGLAGGVTFLASSGDSGAFARGTSTISPEYPTSSPNVVSVGGTRLTVNGNLYASESAWGSGTTSGNGGGGGGISTQEPQPAYQNGTADPFSTTQRVYPDISLEADPGAPGVPIYDTWDYGTSAPWISGYLGGTSLSCPMMAGIIAVVDQGRARAGLGSLDGPTQTLPELYQIASSPSLYAANFHDITTGDNGYAAGTGYDLATGLGSPIANNLVYALAAVPPVITSFTATPNSVSIGTPITLTATVTDPNDGATVSGVDFYLESNSTAGLQTTGSTPDQLLGSGTLTAGKWSFSADTSGLTPGNSTFYALATDSIGNTAAKSVQANITNPSPKPLTVAGGNIYVMEDPNGTQLDVWVDSATPGSGDPTQRAFLAGISGLTLNGTTGDDVLTLDYSAGNFSGNFANGITVNGSTGGANTLAIVGTNDDDTITTNAKGLLFGTSLPGFNPAQINLTRIQTLQMQGGTGGNDTINVVTGTYKINGDTPSGTPNISVVVGTAATVAFTGDQHLANLTVNGAASSPASAALNVDGSVSIDSGGSLLLKPNDPGSGLTDNFGSLFIGPKSSIDIGNTTLLIQSAPDEYVILGYLQNGYAAGFWNGTSSTGGSIKSITAFNDQSGATSIGYGNANDLAFSGSTSPYSFLSGNQMVIKPTLVGDLMLSGSVGANELAILLATYGTTTYDGTNKNTWAYGNIDYSQDGLVSPNDLALLLANYGATTSGA